MPKRLVLIASDRHRTSPQPEPGQIKVWWCDMWRLFLGAGLRGGIVRDVTVILSTSVQENVELLARLRPLTADEAEVALNTLTYDLLLRGPNGEHLDPPLPMSRREWWRDRSVAGMCSPEEWNDFLPAAIADMVDRCEWSR